MPAAVTAPSRPAVAWADSVIGTMSLRQQAAQMVWPNLLGDYVATDAPPWRKLTHLVSELQVGGLLVSVGSPMEIASKLNALQRLAPLPLLVGSDLEYGAGMRARGGYFVPNGIDLGGATVFPPQMAIGATGDTTIAYDEGRITAIEGRALGIHIDFAPVLDVNNNPNNPVINVRSYGSDPHLVAAFGAAFIRGLQANGMVATGKHFPGHGDTDVNSHLALPIVTAPRSRLDSVELVPFRAAVGAGVQAMMTFHGSMPALDPTGTLATLSPPILTGLLRGEMGFHGLIVSDAMDMHALLQSGTATQSIQKAVLAGDDVLIQVGDPDGAVDAIVAGASSGIYPAARITESARRILSLKHTLGLDRQRLVDEDAVRTIVGDSAHRAVAQQAAERSITLVKDVPHSLPLGQMPGSARVLSVTIAHRPDLAAGTAFAAELRRTFPGLRSEFIDADDPGDKPARVLLEADSSDVTIVGSYIGASDHATTVSAPANISAFLEQLSARVRHPILVAFGNPYLLQQIPSIATYVIAWGGLPVSQSAAARAIVGAVPLAGKLPIALPTATAPAGAVESRGVESRK